MPVTKKASTEDEQEVVDSMVCKVCIDLQSGGAVFMLIWSGILQGKMDKFLQPPSSNQETKGIPANCPVFAGTVPFFQFCRP